MADARFQVDAGMADMANELYKQLQPHIQRARDLGQIICFGGHSLGGALATLVCCLAVLHQRLPAPQVQCATFGSPPVLAHRDGKNGDAILQVCLPKAAQLHDGVQPCKNPVTLSSAVKLVAGITCQVCMHATIE